mgnify:CR=1 FL=1
MARIAGVDLPRDKRIEIGLTYIYGIGQTTAKKIVEATGVNPDIRVKDLSQEDEVKLRDYIDGNIMVEGDLRRSNAVRGQKTKTNARTRKGPKRTIANKKK